MGMVQGAVPLGLMFGYIVASCAMWISAAQGGGSDGVSGCGRLACWRYPLLLQGVLTLPLALGALLYIPNAHLQFDRTAISGLNASQACAHLQHLLQNQLYLLLVFAMAGIYFVATGIQYWATVFLINDEQQNVYLVNTLYVGITGSAPVLGVFFGGCFVDRMGGYQHHRTKALRLQFIIAACTFTMAVVCALANTLLPFILSLVLVLFFGAALLPATMGMSLDVVEPGLRPACSAVTTILTNTFGFFLSPFVSGIVMNYSGNYRLGFRMVLLWSAWVVLLLGLATRESSLEQQGKSSSFCGCCCRGRPESSSGYAAVHTDTDDAETI